LRVGASVALSAARTQFSAFLRKSWDFFMVASCRWLKAKGASVKKIAGAIRNIEAAG
jgi:hypothetical protein